MLAAELDNPQPVSTSLALHENFLRKSHERELLKEFITSHSCGCAGHILQQSTSGHSLVSGQCCRSWDREVSEARSISNLASIAAVTLNPITQWEKTSKDRYALEGIARLVPFTWGNKHATDSNRSGVPDNEQEWRVRQRRGRDDPKYAHHLDVHFPTAPSADTQTATVKPLQNRVYTGDRTNPTGKLPLQAFNA